MIITRSRVDQTDVRRIQPTARKRAHRHRLISSERHDIERFLAFARVFSGAVPDADIIRTLEPFVVLGRETYHGAALRADEIVGGNTHGPAQARGHADDLVGGMDRVRPADLRDRFHLLDAREHLDADDRRLQAEQTDEIGGHAREVDLFRCPLLHGVISLAAYAAILVSLDGSGKRVPPLFHHAS